MSLKAKFEAFTSMNYAQQGQAFLNAFWKEHGTQAEDVWTWHLKFSELDLAKGKEGSDLDEFTAHRFLESLGESKTVKEMRTELTEADLDFNKRLALIEYCLWRNKRKISEFVDRPQASSELLDKYQALLEELEVKLKDAQEKTADAQEAEKDFKKADEELKSALAELEAQEKAYEDKKVDLQKKSETGGVVSRNKAKNLLAQHLAEDPLPLQKAKLTTAAASKRAEKAREPFKVKTEAAEKAQQEVEIQFKEAKEELDKLKETAGTSSQGNIFFAQRELEEKKKYMPKSKGGTW